MMNITALKEVLRAQKSQYSLPLMAVLSVQQKLFAKGTDFAGAEVFRASPGIRCTIWE